VKIWKTGEGDQEVHASMFVGGRKGGFPPQGKKTNRLPVGGKNLLLKGKGAKTPVKLNLRRGEDGTDPFLGKPGEKGLQQQHIHKLSNKKVGGLVANQGWLRVNRRT